MKEFLPPHVIGKNRQELGVYYRLTGSIFLGRVEYLRENGEFLGPKTYAYEMPAQLSVDIDNSFDFMIAETLLEKSKLEI